MYILICHFTHTHSHTLLTAFDCGAQFSAVALAILTGWSAALSLIGWERYEGILQRGSKYQRNRRQGDYRTG